MLNCVLLTHTAAFVCCAKSPFRIYLVRMGGRPYYGADCLAGLGQWRQQPFAQRAQAVEHKGKINLRAHTSPAVGPRQPELAAQPALGNGANGRHAPAGILRSWLLGRPWAVAPAAGKRRRAYYEAGCSTGLRQWRQRPARAGGHTTKLAAQPALGNGASGLLRKGPRLSSTKEKSTPALTRARPSGLASGR